MIKVNGITKQYEDYVVFFVIKIKMCPTICDEFTPKDNSSQTPDFSKSSTAISKPEAYIHLGITSTFSSQHVVKVTNKGSF